MLRTAPRPPSARSRATLAGSAFALGAVLLVALHLLPSSRRLDPMLDPLSQYAFAPDGWLFDAGVLALAAGLAALTSALVRGGWARGRSALSAVLVTCAAGLVLVVVFPEHDRYGTVGPAGLVHWGAAMATFGGLALAPALLARGSGPATLGRRAAAIALPAFLVLLAGCVLRYELRLVLPTWWLGLGERVVVVLDFVPAVLLTVLAWRGNPRTVPRSADGGDGDRADGRGAAPLVTRCR